MADFKPSHTERFNQRLNDLARQVVNIPGPGARWDWNKILPADRFEVAYEALLLAVEELGIEAVQAVHEVLAELGPEDAALLQAMMQYESPTEAARALGIPRQTFVDRLDKAKRRFAELYES